ncbi:acyl-CoA carboxylase subunit beta [Candidatus Parcubacteria bacterium]|nr:acyl-CoA carboxylase subunit beta [Candidatus Parcubacteria bacterium]
MSIKENLKKLEEKTKEAEGLKSEIQHQKGKLTARERITLLLDEGSFFELDSFAESRFSQFGMDKKRVAGDGVIVGFGKIDSRQVYIYSQDFTKIGGSLGEAHAKKIVKIMDLALKTGTPVIGIIDSGGARIQEGIASLDGYGSIFKKMIKASGVIPQITVIVGPSAGGASYSPGLSDFVFMVDKIGQMYITGPEVIKSVTGEETSFEALGGSEVHSQKSGCCHFRFNSEENCFLEVRRLLSYLPQNNLETPPIKKGLFSDFFEKENLELSNVIPDKEEKGYDIQLVISEIFDKNSFLEIHKDFAKNVVVGLALLQGEVLGVVAPQPKVLAGVLDVDSSDKIARFVRFCDAFNIPLLNLVDVPGYLPGVDQEQAGIIRHGAKVLYAFSEASVPKVSLILRKAFGGAYIALCSKHLGYDKVITWPSAQLAVMGAEQAVKIIYRKEISAAKDSKKERAEKAEDFKKTLSCFEAAKMGQVDMIIDPKDTRKVLQEIFSSLKDKREAKVSRKHGNMPL